MNVEQFENWVEPKRQSLKRAINKERNPLIKEIMQKELREIDAFEYSLRNPQKTK